MPASKKITNITHDSKKKDNLWFFRLFTAGDELNSNRARNNLTTICDLYLNNENVEIEIIDVIKDYKTALSNKIFITPALIIEEPKPSITIYGNLNDEEKLCSILHSKGAIYK